MSTANSMDSGVILSPVHRTIVAVDIEASTTRTDTVKAGLRTTMYDVLQRALDASGLTEAHRDSVRDRGDGALVLIRPADQVPKTLLLNTFLPTLHDLLAESGAAEPNQLRLRAVVHAGEVHYDRQGCFGEAVDLAARLLDSPTLKMLLRNASGRLMYVISDHFYRSIVRHGYNRLDEGPFSPLVHVRMGGNEHIGWVPMTTAPVDVVAAARSAPATEPGFGRRWRRLPSVTRGAVINGYEDEFSAKERQCPR
jgi:hypothetical protein